jgi:hypothetical protein
MLCTFTLLHIHHDVLFKINSNPRFTLLHK